MRATIFGFFLLVTALSLPFSAQAGTFRDGVTAYQQKDFSKAFETWMPLAEQGHALSQALIGSMYAYGEGVTVDDRQAVAWLTRAAEQGSPQAQFNLGIMYEKGFGVEADPEKAKYWLAQAARQGRKDAASRMLLVGHDFQPGGFEQDSFRPAALTVAAADTELFGPPNVANDGSPAPKIYRHPEDGLLGPPSITENTGAGWLASQPAGHYTIQLAASVHEKFIKAYMAQLKLDDNFAHIISKRDGKTWHAIVYGSYPTTKQARAAIKDLPEQIRAWQPWVRSFSSIKTHQQ